MIKMLRKCIGCQILCSRGNGDQMKKKTFIDFLKKKVAKVWKIPCSGSNGNRINEPTGRFFDTY